MTIEGEAYVYHPFHCLLDSHVHFDAEIIEASTGRPFLSFVLQIDPVLVGQRREALSDVIDPDLGVNIVDLGFVRAVAVKGQTAVITMTLTSAGCR